MTVSMQISVSICLFVTVMHEYLCMYVARHARMYALVFACM